MCVFTRRVRCFPIPMPYFYSVFSVASVVNCFFKNQSGFVLSIGLNLVVMAGRCFTEVITLDSALSALMSRRVG